MNPWHNDELFLYTLEDMRRCLSSKSLFDQLFLAVHLRKLLLDSPTLVSAVNRWQLKIRFEVVRDPFLEVDYEKINEPYASTALSMSRHTPHLYPKRRTKKKAVSLALDAFLTVRTTRLGGFNYTVKDTILVCANKHGAVHFDAPPGKPGLRRRPILGPRERRFDSTDRLSIMRSLSYTKLDVSVLVQIAKVTLKALKPLERNVRGYLDETCSRKRSKSAE